MVNRGTVKFFNHEKGFGFIKDELSGEDVFVHKSAIRGMIHDNDQVEFETERGKKGFSAVNVRAVSSGY